MSKEAIFELAFGGGIDESTRDELLDAHAGWPVLQNIRQPVRGGAVKRYGFGARSTTRFDGTSRTAGRKLLGRAREMLAIDGHTLDTYNAAIGRNVNADRVPDLGIERFPATSLAASLDGSGASLNALDTNTGFAYANGLYFVLQLAEEVAGTAWHLHVTVIDATTKAVVHRFLGVGGAFATNVPEARLCAVGSKVIMAWSQTGATTNLKAVTFDATSATTLAAGPSASSNLATNYGGNGWDICGLETSFALAFTMLGGITVRRFSTALAQLATGLAVNDVTAKFVAVDGSEADFIWIAYGKTGTASGYVTGLSAACAITSTELAVITGVSAGLQVNQRSRFGVRRTSSTGGTLITRGDLNDTSGRAFSYGGWHDTATRAFSTAAGATTAVGTRTTLMGWTPYSQPFVLDGRIYAFAACTAETGMPQNIVAFDITEYDGMLRPVASPAAGNCIFEQHPATAHLQAACKHVVMVSSTKAAVLIPVANNATDAALQIVEIDCKATHLWQSAEHNGVTYLSAGQVYGYDGVQLFESSFVAPPALRVVDGGAGSIAAGTYLYTAIVEWPDAEGNVHWSEPAPPASITIVANHQVFVDVLGYFATWRDQAFTAAGIFTSALRVKIFRTKNGGGDYYLIGTYPVGTTVISITDNATDASIGSAAKLYTAIGTVGAALVRRAPPSAVSLTEYRGMLVAITEDRKGIVATGQQIAGEGAWWNPIFQVPITSAGDLIAIAAQDGTLFPFAKRAIFALTGEPPSDNGSSGGLGEPRRLAVDIGCIEPRSLVGTSLGIFFQSDRGIELLTRAQSIADPPIGFPVRETVAAFPVCTAATLDAAQGLVYFEMAAAEVNGAVSGEGRTLVFDLRQKHWVSVDKRYGATGAIGAPAQSGAYVYDAAAGAMRYAWLGTDGAAYVEDHTTRLDAGGQWVPKKAETSWIHSAGVQSEQSVDRVLMLFDRITDHDLTITVFFDYDEARVETKTFAAADIATLGREWLDRELVQSTSTAIKVRIEDVTPSSGVVGTGEGATWIGLAFPGIQHRGVKRTSAAQRGG